MSPQHSACQSDESMRLLQSEIRYGTHSSPSCRTVNLGVLERMPNTRLQENWTEQKNYGALRCPSNAANQVVVLLGFHWADLDPVHSPCRANRLIVCEQNSLALCSRLRKALDHLIGDARGQALAEHVIESADIGDIGNEAKQDRKRLARHKVVALQRPVGIHEAARCAEKGCRAGLRILWRAAQKARRQPVDIARGTLHYRAVGQRRGELQATQGNGNLQPQIARGAEWVSRGPRC